METKSTLAVEDFDVAKAVFEELKDVPRERQERVLRWISEGFGITMAPQVPHPHVEARAPGTATQLISELSSPSAGLRSVSRDIKSFIAEKAPKNDMQFATAAAYYYRFDAPPAQRRDAIDREVLQEAARLAGRSRLLDPLKTLNNAKGAGYLDTAGRGQFAINSVGENLVAMALPADGSTTSAKKGRTKNAKHKGKQSTKKGARGKKAG